MNKTKILYERRNNPNQDAVTFLAIKADYFNPCVAKIYTTKNEGDLLELPDDFVTLPIETARMLFDFEEIQEGKLVEILNR